MTVNYKKLYIGMHRLKFCIFEDLDIEPNCLALLLYEPCDNSFCKCAVHVLSLLSVLMLLLVSGEGTNLVRS